MNKFKIFLTKQSNSVLISRELHTLETNQRTEKPIIDKFLGQIYKVHYTTFRKLKFFKSTDWYTFRTKFIKDQSEGTYFLFVGDDVDKLADDAYPMFMRIRSDILTLKSLIVKEYPLATWMAAITQKNINKEIVKNLELEVVQIISEDRCYLFFKSKFHGDERLKAEYYFRTRTLIFDIEE